MRKLFVRRVKSEGTDECGVLSARHRKDILKVLCRIEKMEVFRPPTFTLIHVHTHTRVYAHTPTTPKEGKTRYLYEKCDTVLTTYTKNR